jgi:hypothetical protein
MSCEDGSNSKGRSVRTRQERKGMEVEWISRVIGTCTEMTRNSREPRKERLVVTRLFFCHFEAVVRFIRPSSYVAGDLKGLGFRDLRGSFTPCFPPRLGMIGLSCDF